jgi:hypothetical protein
METKITEVSGWTKEAKEEFTPNAPVKVIKQTPLTWKKEETFYTYDEIIQDYSRRIVATDGLVHRCKLLEEVIDELSKKLVVATSPTRRGKITDREKWKILELSENYGRWSILFEEYGEDVAQEIVKQKVSESQEALVNFINKLLTECD